MISTCNLKRAMATTTTLMRWIIAIVVYMHIIMFARIQALGCIRGSPCWQFKFLALRMSPKVGVIKKPSIQKRPVVARPSLAIQFPQFDDDDREKKALILRRHPVRKSSRRSGAPLGKNKLGRTWELLTIREAVGKVREVWVRHPPPGDYE